MEVLGYLLVCLGLLWGLLRVFRRVPSQGAKGKPKLPPGPSPLPVVGNLLSLGRRSHRTLADLARTYGPVMSLKLGCIRSVVISSAAAAREVMQKHDLTFSDRTVPDSVRNCDHHLHSVGWIPVSPKWRSLRRISKTHIFSAERLADKQDLRRKKVDDLLVHIRQCAGTGKAVDIGTAAFSTTLNLLSNTIFSVDLADASSDTAREFKSLVSDMLIAAAEPNLSDFFPVLRHLDIQGIRRRMTIYNKKLLKIIDQFINTRLAARKETDYRPVNDVLDVLMGLYEDNSFEEIDLTDVQHFLLDLFAAGADTTANTVEWVMAELIHNPTCLSKVRKETERIIGGGRAVQESDIPNLPYLQAVVKETFRMHPPTPLLVPRMAREDTEIMGFTIPRGAQVLINAYAIGRDSQSWKDPEVFMPERFLGSDVNIDVKGSNFELIPFGAGRRICPGYPLAQRMVPLMVASMVQGFDWKTEGKGEDMSLDDVFGLVVRLATPLCAIPIPVN
ncbi:hypothetical protein SAY86_003718 [Trapa natans]|uniref:Uncharacterized protein n=1 Tax=Trapa natans TaxID=22666 RepID=A0AAN7N2C0_TRANT|nr:hypothetical protein SAY86_003718 [Trapa natans]